MKFDVSNYMPCCYREQKVAYYDVFSQGISLDHEFSEGDGEEETLIKQHIRWCIQQLLRKILLETKEEETEITRRLFLRLDLLINIHTKLKNTAIDEIIRRISLEDRKDGKHDYNEEYKK